jgi:copper chaperone CopZ
MSSLRRTRATGDTLKRHNHKITAGLVLLMGAGLLGVTIRHNRVRAERALELPVLSDIPSTIDVNPGAGEVLRAYRITGMCCESCTRKLHARISELEGVDECAVDLFEERLSVIVSQAVAPERLLSTLSFDKYSAVELP